jgi:hypothetical protein
MTNKFRFKIGDPVMVTRHSDGTKLPRHKWRAAIVTGINKAPRQTAWAGNWLVTATADLKDGGRVYLQPEEGFELLSLASVVGGTESNK